MRNYLLTLSAALGVALAAQVFQAHADDCSDAQGGQAGLDECADNSFKKADAELNKLYKEIEARLKDDPDTTKLLVTAQRAWIAYRDAECTFQSSGAAGGSIYPMTYSMCLDGQTQIRIQDFQNYLKCEEGDVSCPVPSAN